MTKLNGSRRCLTPGITTGMKKACILPVKDMAISNTCLAIAILKGKT